MSTMSFWGSMYSLRSRGSILQKILLSADSAPAHTARTTQQLFAESPTLADWQLYSPDLNPLVCYLACFAVKGPGYTSC
jgi:hypothetical protein